jgi:hypothetical protein
MNARIKRLAYSKVFIASQDFSGSIVTINAAWRRNHISLSSSSFGKKAPLIYMDFHLRTLTQHAF